MNQFNRIPNWLRAALGTTKRDLPNRLDTSAVLPVVEIIQGGWAHYRPRYQILTLAAGSTIGTRLLLAASDVAARLVLSVSITRQGGTVDQDFSLRTRNTLGLGFVGWGQLTVPPTPAGNASIIRTFPLHVPIFQPVNSDLQVTNVAAVEAGDTLEIATLSLPIDPGVNPY